MSTLLLIIFNNTTTTEIYTLSLHDALPIYDGAAHRGERVVTVEAVLRQEAPWAPAGHVVSRGQWAEPAAAAGGPRRGSGAGAVRVPLAQAPVGFAGAELTSLAGQAGIGRASGRGSVEGGAGV